MTNCHPLAVQNKKQKVKKYFSVFLSLLIIIASALLLSSPLRAQVLAVPLQKGFDWLDSQVTVSGQLTNEAVSVALPEQTRFEVLMTYALFGQTTPVALSALTGNYTGSALELLARKAIAQQQSGVSAEATLSELLAYQNVDGGFGATALFPSNTLDTSWALIALAGHAYGKAQTAKAVSWLINAQQANGYWERISPLQDDEFIVTTVAAQALWYYRGTGNSDSSLAKARQWLAGKKNAYGHWGDVFHTTHALLAILPSLGDASSEQAAINAVLDQQQTNGSWNHDPYLTALVLQALWMANQPSPNPDLATVSGTVVDDITGLPVSGAVVTLGKNSLTQTTGHNGQFLFTHLASGPEELRIEAAGYRSIKAVLSLRTGQNLALGTLRMLRGAETHAVVTGIAKYLDANNVPRIAANAVIMIGSVTVKTDSQGAYRVEGISPGLINITASYTNYPNIETSLNVLAGDVISFDPQFVKSVTTGFTLNITVIDDVSGLPLSGVTVRLNGNTATTNAQGVALFSDSKIKNGDNNLQLSKVGYNSLLLNVNINTYQGTAAEATFRLPPATGNQTILKGTVTDQETGQFIPGVTVSLSGSALTAKTNAQGNYEFSGTIPTGSRTLTFSHPGYIAGSAWAFTITSGYTNIANVSLRPAESGISAATLSVTAVERGTNLPLEGVQVKLEGANSLEQETDANGQAHIANLISGETRIQLYKVGYETLAATVEVKPGQTYILPVEMAVETSPTPRLFGYITDAVTKTPLVGTKITVSGAHDATGISDSRGYYEFSLLSLGTVMISVEAAGYETLHYKISLKGSAEFNIPLVPVWQAAQQNWEVYGRILDSETQEALVGAEILLQESIPGSAVTAEQHSVAGPSGDFLFKGLNEEYARLMITMPGYDTKVVPFKRISSTSQSLGSIVLQRSYNAALPDLQLTAIDRSSLSMDPNTFIASGTVTATVVNNSNYDADSFNVVAFIDRNNNQQWDPDVDTPLGKVRINELQQSSQTVSFDLHNVTFPFRDAPLYLMVDADLEVLENIEGNNTLRAAVTCAGGGGGFHDVAVCIDTSGSVSSLYNLEMEGVIKAVENPNIIPHDGSVRFTLGTDREMYYGPFIPLHQAVFVDPSTLPTLLNDLKTKKNTGGYSSGPTCALKLSEYLNTLPVSGSTKTLILVGDGAWEGIPKTKELLPKTIANGVGRIDVIGVGSVDIKQLEENAWPKPVNTLHGGQVTVAYSSSEVATAMAQALSNAVRSVDLTLGAFKLIDQGKNSPFRLTVRIGNAGSIAQATTVRFYQGGVLLGEAPVPELLPGAYTDVTLNGVTLSGIDPLIAIVDEQRINAECNTTNNRQQIDLQSANRLASLMVSTDKSSYPANTATVFAARVSNLGSFPAAFSLELSVEDTQGHSVHSFPVIDLGIQYPESLHLHDQSWNTGMTLAGDYLLVGRLYDSENQQVAKAQTSFQILGAPMGQALASLRLVADKEEYNLADRVEFESLAQNLSLNQSIPGARVTLTVQAPDSSIVFTRQNLLGTLSAGGAPVVFNTPYAFTNAAQGGYTAIAELRDGSDRLLATANTTYRVKESGTAVLVELSGSISLSKPSLKAGEKQTRSDTVRNEGSTSLQKLTIERLLINEADSSEIALLSSTHTLGAGQTLSWPDVAIPTHKLLEGNYWAVLIAEINGQDILLDSQTFTVTQSFGAGAGIQGGMLTTGAIVEDGNVYVWGFRGSSQQGNGTMVVASNAAPAKVASLNNVVALTGGAYHLIALDANGDVYGWGQSGYGETGCAPTQSIYVSTPCKVLSNATQIAAGEYFSVALDTRGQVWTWGHNLYGQLGDGKTANSRTPVAVSLNGETARLIGGAYEGAFAVTEEGHVWAWGDNEASGLGVQGPNYGVQQIRRSPVHITNLDPYADQIIYIAGGNGWGEALLDDGTVIGWGARASLGQGTTSTASSSPLPVTILTNVKQLYARYVGSIALRSNGEIYTWGQTGGSAFPMVYGAAPTLRAMVNGAVTEVGGGKEHLFYKTEDGKMYGVGYNDLYKLDQSKCCAPIIDWPGKEIRMH